MKTLLALLTFTCLAAAAPCELNWTGERNEELRASFARLNGVPTITEIAIRKPGGQWLVLGRFLSPEFEVVSGKRRLSEQQMAPLRELGIAMTPEVVEREQWNAFWDAPLNVPGDAGKNLNMPRRPEEIRRSKLKYSGEAACVVKRDGIRTEVSFPGAELGIFKGALRFTAYEGSNLLRQEIIASTTEQAVAYKYNAGLTNFNATRIDWRDTARAWQKYEFGGSLNKDAVALKARNRLAILEEGGGSIAVFPPPHKFFFAREMETNLGYVYYRKDSPTRTAIGIRQPEREEGYKPYGISDDLWRRRVAESRGELQNFALYNAPPGTMQRMPVYFYLSADNAAATAERVLAYTHDDVYKPLDGFKVLVSHFHFHLNEQLTDAGSMDLQPTWLQVFRALGINIAILADFHGDSHATDTGQTRLDEQRVYFEGSRRFSDKDFLLIPGEEPDANFGGHYMFVFPKPVYFTHLRKPTEPVTQPFIEQNSSFGTVYHTATAANELDLLRKENGLVWQTHPRTKGSAGYPDATKDTAFFLSDRFLGGSFQSLPVDQSEQRLCEKRCLGLMDEMNTWADAKYMIAEGDTYMKYPDDETYPQLVVNYVKLPQVPRFDDGWQPVLDAMRKGDYFITSGEVLLRNWSVANGVFNADVEWTFPPEFAEVVWGDGKTTGRQIVPLSARKGFGNEQLRIPFDAAGKKWVRFSIWDSAGNGAFTQPVALK